RERIAWLCLRRRRGYVDSQDLPGNGIAKPATGHDEPLLRANSSPPQLGLLPIWWQWLPAPLPLLATEQHHAAFVVPPHACVVHPRRKLGRSLRRIRLLRQTTSPDDVWSAP